jgi:hypothetical protein
MMSEAEWLACADPTPMLEFLWSKASERKLRLFVVACCQRVWDHLPGASRAALTVVERFADGAASRDELLVAEEAAGRAAETSDGEAVWLAANSDVWFAATEVPCAAAGREVVLGWPGRNDQGADQFAQERRDEARFVRDIFGNPFRSTAVAPAWLTSTVVALAEGIYQERAFDRMPILADALQDGGCANEDVLNHCRRPNEHVRGCWVIDLLLGKE